MKTLLFVDDDTGFRELCRRVFEEEGYCVLLARDGAAALAMVAAQPPDVAILDVRMPAMSGLELAEELRASAGGSHYFLHRLRRHVHVGLPLQACRGVHRQESRIHRSGDGRDQDIVARPTCGYVPPGIAAAIEGRRLSRVAVPERECPPRRAEAWP